MPTTSTVNPSTAIAFNGAASAIPTSGPNAGQFGLYATLQTDAIVDVFGYYAPSNATSGRPGVLADLQLLTPLRVLDTRPTNQEPGVVTTGVLPNGQPITAGQLPAGQVRRFLLAGQSFPGGALPADVQGVLLNVTIKQAGPSGGFETVFPGDVPDGSRPNASSVNPSTFIAASFWGSGIAPAGGLNAGTLAVYQENGPRDVIVDVLGFFR